MGLSQLSGERGKKPPAIALTPKKLDKKPRKYKNPSAVKTATRRPLCDTRPLYDYKGAEIISAAYPAYYAAR